jgi:hypothetical protein
MPAGASPARLSVSDHSVVFTERAQHLDCQIIEAAFPVGPLFAPRRFGIQRRPSRCRITDC